MLDSQKSPINIPHLQRMRSILTWRHPFVDQSQHIIRYSRILSKQMPYRSSPLLSPTSEGSRVSDRTVRLSIVRWVMVRPFVGVLRSSRFLYASPVRLSFSGRRKPSEVDVLLAVEKRVMWSNKKYDKKSRLCANGWRSSGSAA